MRGIFWKGLILVFTFANSRCRAGKMYTALNSWYKVGCIAENIKVSFLNVKLRFSKKKWRNFWNRTQITTFATTMETWGACRVGRIPKSTARFPFVTLLVRIPKEIGKSVFWRSYQFTLRPQNLLAGCWKSFMSIGFSDFSNLKK